MTQTTRSDELYFPKFDSGSLGFDLLRICNELTKVSFRGESENGRRFSTSFIFNCQSKQCSYRPHSEALKLRLTTCSGMILSSTLHDEQAASARCSGKERQPRDGNISKSTPPNRDEGRRHARRISEHRRLHLQDYRLAVVDSHFDQFLRELA